jgi:hypothetical protein
VTELVQEEMGHDADRHGKGRRDGERKADGKLDKKN